MTEPPLHRPVTSLEGVGPKRGESLAALGIRTLADLLGHFPRRYEDRRNVAPIADAAEGETITVLADVVSARARRLKGRMNLCECVLQDRSGTIKATWFGRGFLARTFTPGARGYFTGTVGAYQGLALKNPDYELLERDGDDTIHTNRIVPIYPLGEGVTQRFLRGLIHRVLVAHGPEWASHVPPALSAQHGFPPVAEALRACHFPEDDGETARARSRFAYEELLTLQAGVLAERAARKDESGVAHRAGGPLFAALRKALPFALTAGQEAAIARIVGDMADARPMFRLLQGDVGCGKTVVAMHAIACAADGGYQTAIMAPTEILAEQHAITMSERLAPLGIEVAVLTGSTKGAKAVREAVAEGRVQVVTGTHALIQESTTFHRLGLAIIDEQHRFGVMQRSALTEKGLRPDVLHMTATPIPRTMAITVYGGMDLTLIEDMPPGREPVKTRAIPEGKVAGMHAFIREEVERGRQIYYVCPLVEESDKVELASATNHFEELSSTVYDGLRTDLLHGRMSGAEKDAVMRTFKAGKTDILFATTVIEVGVDVPNASIMVIENADRFGLPQLHQLRGRVGRGGGQAYCFVLGKPATKEGRQRIKVFCSTNSGFDIAEADLDLRGPGELAGFRQAGLSDLRFADLIRDVRLLDAARRDAEALIEADPTLSRHPDLARAAAASRPLKA